MRNLLQETKEVLNDIGKTFDDVVYIGEYYGEECMDVETFKLDANAKYDSGYGSAIVREDLVITFKDGTWIERWEYDGSEGWTPRRSPPASAGPGRLATVWLGQ